MSFAAAPGQGCSMSIKQATPYLSFNGAAEAAIELYTRALGAEAQAGVMRYAVDALAGLLRDDAIFSMPPFSLWLQGPEPVRTWLLGRGFPCRGSRLVPTAACGSPSFAQYKPNADGGYSGWALVVLELSGDRIATWTSFLDVKTLFPRFGLPLVID